MYSWEIDNAIKSENYNISVNTYKEICKSPQVDHIKYEPFGNCFHVWTNDGYYWSFCIRKDGCV